MTLNVSEKTKDEIVKFFIRTSIPRIIAERKKEEKDAEVSVQ